MGLQALTSAAYRAYELADIYRRKGIKVVLGGIHVSMMPDEAEKYADAIVIGEAESIWLKLLEDFKNKSLKKRYYGQLSELNNGVFPRRDLFHENYSYANIQNNKRLPDEL